MASKFPMIHFEIPADDVERAVTFYRSLFGWKISDPMKMEYFICETKDAQGHGIDGGIMKRKMPGQPFTNYIFTRSIDDLAPKITAAGGEIVLPKMEIGEGIGWILCFKDPEGNIIGLHQPSEKMMAQARAQPKQSARKKLAKKAAKKAPKKAPKKKAKKKAKRR
jgi:uncharacterized protein